jgi:hypothetical protein
MSEPAQSSNAASWLLFQELAVTLVMLYWLLSLTRTQHQEKHGDDQITCATERVNQDKSESLTNRSTLIQTFDTVVCCWISNQHSSAWIRASVGLRIEF